MENKKANNVVTFYPGEFLAKGTCGCDALYVIQEGQLEVYQTGKNGDKVVLGIIGSGEYVGETALLMNRSFTSNVVALTKVKAIKLSKATVDAQLKKVPQWLIALTKGLIVRLQAANETIRKNGLVDEKLTSAIQAIESNRNKAS